MVSETQNPGNLCREGLAEISGKLDSDLYMAHGLVKPNIVLMNLLSAILVVSISISCRKYSPSSTKWVTPIAAHFFDQMEVTKKINIPWNMFDKLFIKVL